MYEIEKYLNIELIILYFKLITKILYYMIFNLF